jgi:hypothetical protein
MMTDQLHDLLPSLEKLPPKARGEIVTHIKALIEEMMRYTTDHANVKIPSIREQATWYDPLGAWSDLPDTMLDELDQLRHSNSPTPSNDYTT